MPAYQGGKGRIGRRIHDFITSYERIFWGQRSCKTEDNMPPLPPYFEPFVGMGGVMRHFGLAQLDDRQLIACDVSVDMILMWRALQDGWEPVTECTLEKFNELKYSEPSPERAFIGCIASWGGNWFHSYRLKYAPQGTDYLEEGARGIRKLRDEMKNVRFLPATSYHNHHPVGMTVYCDPPYHGNKLATESFRNFDHAKFWDVMREWSKTNLVFISESSAPDDFVEVWSARSTVAVNKGMRAKHYMDRLFVHESIHSKTLDN